MAVDTRNKRASALGVMVPIVPTFPLADGNIANQADRQHAAFSYIGILAGGAPVAPDVTNNPFASRVFFSRVISGGVFRG